MRSSPAKGNEVGGFVEIDTGDSEYERGWVDGAQLAKEGANYNAEFVVDGTIEGARIVRQQGTSFSLARVRTYPGSNDEVLAEATGFAHR